MNTNRIYGHQELALLYFPNVLPSSASTQLTRFIRRDPELLSALEAIGYRKGIRLYTPLQVRTIVDHMGDPENWNLSFPSLNYQFSIINGITVISPVIQLFFSSESRP